MTSWRCSRANIVEVELSFVVGLNSVGERQVWARAGLGGEEGGEEGPQGDEAQDAHLGVGRKGW
jgi:hypothetical protein